MTEELMTPREVADLLRVNPRQVARWAREGKLESVSTPGGHRRFRRSDVDVWLEREEAS